MTKIIFVPRFPLIPCMCHMPHFVISHVKSQPLEKCQFSSNSHRISHVSRVTIITVQFVHRKIDNQHVNGHAISVCLTVIVNLHCINNSTQSIAWRNAFCVGTADRFIHHLFAIQWPFLCDFVAIIVRDDHLVVFTAVEWVQIPTPSMP